MEQMPMIAVQPDMKRDGRTVSRAALEEMRLMALEHMNEGKPTALKINGQPLLDNIAYEPFGPVSGWEWKTSGNSTTYQRTYDQNGRTVRITQADLLAAYHHFDYDNLDRLTRAETIGASGNTVLRYGYDGTGNRRLASVNGEEATYTTEAASNRLLRVEGTTNLVTETYGYDLNGSTVSHQTVNGENTFTYDERGRLIRANGTQYKINALEQRIEKQGNGADTSSGTIHFVYDEQGHLIGEYDPISGIPKIEHIWLDDWPVAAIKDNQIYYVYPDHLSTPRAITDTKDQTVWYWNYDEPFGETKPNDNPSNLGVFIYNLRFPGQYYDEETGLYYNWHRTYDPSVGKYLESDPIGLRGGLNTYAYVDANPLLYSDEDGLQKKGPPKGFGEAVDCGLWADKILAALNECDKECACDDVMDEIKCRAKYSPDDQASARWKLKCACQKMGVREEDCMSGFKSCVKARWLLPLNPIR